MEEESNEERIITPSRKGNIRYAGILISVTFSLLAFCILYMSGMRATKTRNPSTPNPKQVRLVHNTLRPADEEINGWKKNQSRNVTDYIHPYDTTIISGQEICADNNTELVIIVPTTPAKFEERNTIRDTWASHGVSKVKVGFIVGLTNDESLQTILQLENDKFHDVIQEDLVEGYNNMTLKSVALLKWYIQRCENSSFLMKVDDDSFLDVKMLVAQLANYSRQGMLLGLPCHHCAPFRDPKSKYYTPMYMFGDPVFPDYLFGRAYLMSMDVAIKLFAAALVSPILHLEDVYITGICAQEAGVNITELKKAFGNESDVEQCLRMKRRCRPSYTIYHSVKSAAMMRFLWEVRKHNGLITAPNSKRLLGDDVLWKIQSH